MPLNNSVDMKGDRAIRKGICGDHPALTLPRIGVRLGSSGWGQAIVIKYFLFPLFGGGVAPMPPPFHDTCAKVVGAGSGLYSCYFLRMRNGVRHKSISIDT